MGGFSFMGQVAQGTPTRTTRTIWQLMLSSCIALQVLKLRTLFHLPYEYSRIVCAFLSLCTIAIIKYCNSYEYEHKMAVGLIFSRHCSFHLYRKVFICTSR
jgi:hypothetical protein